MLLKGYAQLKNENRLLLEENERLHARVQELESHLAEALANSRHLESVIADSQAYEAMMLDGADAVTTPPFTECEILDDLVQELLSETQLLPDTDQYEWLECEDI